MPSFAAGSRRKAFSDRSSWHSKAYDLAFRGKGPLSRARLAGCPVFVRPEETAKGSLGQGSLGLRPEKRTPHSAKGRAPRMAASGGGRSAVGTALSARGVLSRAAAVARAVAGPGTVARPVAARAVIPGPEVAAALPAALPASATVARRPPGAAAVTLPAVAGAFAVRAGAVAVAGLRRKGVHERQSGAGKAKGGKKLSACHGNLLCPREKSLLLLHRACQPEKGPTAGAVCNILYKKWTDAPFRSCHLSRKWAGGGRCKARHNPYTAST